MKRNNVDLGAVQKFVEQAKADPARLCKQKRVEGSWQLEEGKPQFITVTVDADADDKKLADLERRARQRCPGVYCLTNPIPLATKVQRTGGP